VFALAGCLGREGEYLDDILDHGWAVCEQATWVLPAHLGDNEGQVVSGLPGVVPDEERHGAPLSRDRPASNRQTARR